MRLTACLLLPLVLTAHAAERPAPRPDFNGPDFSGTYQCKGQDQHEGPYTGIVTLKLVLAHSVGQHGAYDFALESPGYGRYLGHAAGEGRMLAVSFALTDQRTKDYGTGIARWTRNAKGKWQFAKFYFEPEFKGGNDGTETCVQD